MNVICGFVLLLLITLTSSQLNDERTVLTTANNFFHSVDPERRDLLVKHFLTDALEKLNIRVYPDPRVADPISEFGDPPMNFANNLLFWSKSTIGISSLEIARAIQENQVNTDPNGCNPHDLGCHCCPF